MVMMINAPLRNKTLMVLIPEKQLRESSLQRDRADAQQDNWTIFFADQSSTCYDMLLLDRTTRIP
jgi:hypothetical protein